jgi:hypothetical protein|tara:strand:+ start:547 stop:945 length:399 start_codon:yes stop_codon:yes gene_type:complete
MSLVDVAQPEREGTSKLEIEFHEQALAEFDSTERDSGIWTIVCEESAENLKPLNLKGEAYTKAYDEAAKRLYVKLRANALFKGYTLLKWINRIIWISVFSLVLLGSLSAFIGGAFEGFEPRALFDQLLQQIS